MIKSLIPLVCFFSACGAPAVQEGTATCGDVPPIYVALQHNGVGPAGSYTATRKGVARFPRAIYSLTGSVNTSMRAYVTVGSSLCEYRPPANGQAFVIHTCPPGQEVDLQEGDTITLYRDGGGVLVEGEISVL